MDPWGLLSWSEAGNIVVDNLKATPGRMAQSAVDTFYWPSNHPDKAILFMLGGELAALNNAPNLSKPYSRGSTGRNCPGDLKEQMALSEVMSNPTAGRPIPNIRMNDPRWPAKDGWVKMSQNVNGVEVHYTRNIRTGVSDDFKIK